MKPEKLKRKHFYSCLWRNSHTEKTNIMTRGANYRKTFHQSNNFTGQVEFHIYLYFLTFAVFIWTILVNR
jgi:hypothetical protein